MKLLFSPLIAAVKTLEEALAEPYTVFMRDAIIQRFEYTYELAWKLIKRALEIEDADAEEDMLTKKDLFRKAAEAGLITDPEVWFEYHKARNLTSHAYDEVKADQVYAAAQKFPASVHELLNQLHFKYDTE